MFKVEIREWDSPFHAFSRDGLPDTKTEITEMKFVFNTDIEIDDDTISHAVSAITDELVRWGFVDEIILDKIDVVDIEVNKSDNYSVTIYMN